MYIDSGKPIWLGYLGDLPEFQPVTVVYYRCFGSIFNEILLREEISGVLARIQLQVPLVVSNCLAQTDRSRKNATLPFRFSEGRCKSGHLRLNQPSMSDSGRARHSTRPTGKPRFVADAQAPFFTLFDFVFAIYVFVSFRILNVKIWYTCQG